MAVKTGYKHRSPGPKYLLPTTIGITCNDPTVRHSPAFYFGTVPRKSCKMSGPGPKYDSSGFLPKGKEFSPAFYFGVKPKDITLRAVTPSPQSYGTHLCPDTRHVRPPSWELGNPYKKTFKMSGPAPKYMVPQIIGATPPDVTTAPAYSISGLDAKLKKTSSPGPGKYGPTDPEVYFPRSPTPAILPRRIKSTLHSQTTPGPKYFNRFNYKVEPPSYTFGVKHSMYEVITYMPEDKQPFYGI